MMTFLKQKGIALDGKDLSRKGSIDEPILALVQYINKSEHYFTTSSCSGRILIFEQLELQPELDVDRLVSTTSTIESDKEHPTSFSSPALKQGCRWLYTTHSECEEDKMISSLTESRGEAFVKFEPFVLHVQCETVDCAQLIHAVAVQSGFRNSGISIGRAGKIITAVRSTHSLQAPVTLKGKSIVSLEYMQHLTKLCNEKAHENLIRIDRFYTNLKLALEKSKATLKSKEQKQIMKQRKRLENTAQHKPTQHNPTEHKPAQHIPAQHKSDPTDGHGLDSEEMDFDSIFTTNPD